jgi:hypothetical protein
MGSQGSPKVISASDDVIYQIVLRRRLVLHQSTRFSVSPSRRPVDFHMPGNFVTSVLRRSMIFTVMAHRGNLLQFQRMDQFLRWPIGRYTLWRDIYIRGLLSSSMIPERE